MSSCKRHRKSRGEETGWMRCRKVCVGMDGGNSFRKQLGHLRKQMGLYCWLDSVAAGWTREDDKAAYSGALPRTRLDWDGPGKTEEEVYTARRESQL